jgi:hypothetical protein
MGIAARMQKKRRTIVNGILTGKRWKIRVGIENQNSSERRRKW